MSFIPLRDLSLSELRLASVYIAAGEHALLRADLQSLSKALSQAETCYRAGRDLISLVQEQDRAEIRTEAENVGRNLERLSRQKLKQDESRVDSAFWDAFEEWAGPLEPVSPAQR
jgi:hypothetical protein